MLVVLAGWAVMPSITAQAATTLSAGSEDPPPQITGRKAAAAQLLSSKTAATQLLSNKTAASQLLSSKAPAAQLLSSKAAAAQLLSSKAAAAQLASSKAAAERLISKRAAAKQLSDNGSTAAKLTDLRAEAGYRSVRLSWRLEPAPKRLEDEAANSFRIRYCENQVKHRAGVQEHVAQYCKPIKKKEIFLIYSIRKFRMEQLQSHI
jgi:hypothetical protein